MEKKREEGNKRNVKNAEGKRSNLGGKKTTCLIARLCSNELLIGKDNEKKREKRSEGEETQNVSSEEEVE